MIKSIVFALLIILISFTKSETPISVVTFFRHSERQPQFQLNSELEIIREAGEITDHGIELAYNKGKSYCQSYPSYCENTSRITILSSPSPRCIITLYSRLLGITANELDYDKVLINAENKQFYENYVESLKIYERDTDFTFQIDYNPNCRRAYLENLAKNPNVSKFESQLEKDSEDLPEIKSAAESFNRNLPDGEKYILSQAILLVADFFKYNLDKDLQHVIETRYSKLNQYFIENNTYAIMQGIIASDDNLNRMYISNFFNKLIAFFDNEVFLGRSDVLFFSGHDINMMSILYALGFDLKKAEFDFNTEIDFELYLRDFDYYIDIKIDGKSIIGDLEACHHQECLLSRFIHFIKTKIATNEEVIEFCRTGKFSHVVS